MITSPFFVEVIQSPFYWRQGCIKSSLVDIHRHFLQLQLQLQLWLELAVPSQTYDVKKSLSYQSQQSVLLDVQLCEYFNLNNSAIPISAISISEMPISIILTLAIFIVAKNLLEAFSVIIGTTNISKVSMMPNRRNLRYKLRLTQC